MPSASSKPDNKGSPEPSDPMKNAILVIEKKVRNLEKRKGKLDNYREMRRGGDKLNKDQEEAIAKYDSVLTNLEFARELQKQFASIQVDAEKLMKKQAKRERLERQGVEMKRVQAVLQLQNTLDNMGSDEARDNFLNGTKGAVKLTQDDLDHLDELYKLISPSRDTEPSYVEQLTMASEHIVSFLDAKEKEVAGTTYKDLKEVVAKINECGYFENKGESEVVEEEKESEEVSGNDKQEEHEEEEQEKVDHGNEKDNLGGDDPAPADHHEVQSGMLKREPVVAAVEESKVNNMGAASSESHNIAGHPNTPTEYPQDDESFFTTEPYPRPRPFQVTRPFKEIVSSVQGTFNFLQESQIMSEVAASDPAVIVATSTSLAHSESHLVQPAAYSSGTLLSNESSRPSAPSQPSSGVMADSMGGAADHSGASVPSSLVSQAPMDTYSSAGQDYFLGSQPPGTGSAGLSFMSEQMGGLEQGLGGASDVPPAIPMPNQASHGMAGSEASQEQQLEDEKKQSFTMNPNAKMFRSMYSAQGGQNQGGGFSQSGDEGFSQSHDYQGGFGSNGYSQRSRGRGGSRGGNGGGRGMSNGYMRGGRNNSNANGAPYSGGGRREGGFNNSRGGNRGSRGGGPSRGGQMRGRGNTSGGFGSPRGSAAASAAQASA